MNEVCDAVPVVHPAVVVVGLEGLAGAVGLLGGHAAVLAVQGGARVAAFFAAPAPGQGAVPPVLHVHDSRSGRVLMGAGKSGLSWSTCHSAT